jgi:hypothetical protein
MSQGRQPGEGCTGMMKWWPVQVTVTMDELTKLRTGVDHAVRIMARAASWVGIKEAAFPSHKGAAIGQEMRAFVERYKA